MRLLGITVDRLRLALARTLVAAAELVRRKMCKASASGNEGSSESGSLAGRTLWTASSHLGLQPGHSGRGFFRFHEFCGDLILEKHEHSLVSRSPGIHLCNQVINARAPNLNLSVFLVRDEREVQGSFGADYLLD